MVTDEGEGEAYAGEDESNSAHVSTRQLYGANLPLVQSVAVACSEYRQTERWWAVGQAGPTDNM